jgi:hypothetical protein
MPLPFFVVPFVMAAARVALAGAGRAIAQSAAARAVPVIAQTASRAASSVGNAARAAGPLTTVGAGVTGLSLTASSLGAVPQRTSSQSSSSQSSSRSNQPRSGGPAPSGGGGGGGTSGNPVAQPEVPESTSSGEVAAEPASGTGTAESAPTPVEKVVKSANIETILFNDEEFSSEFLVDLLFESVAGQELLTIARNDTVNGQDVVYQPIKNLNILQDTYNPTKLLAVYDTSDSFFGAFAIDLSSKIPSVGTGPGGKNYYLTDLGDLVIEVVNIANDEQVEFQIADSGTIDELGI